jgi:hypothetical protein
VQVRLCAKGFGGANIVRLVKTLQASGAPGPEDNTDTHDGDGVVQVAIPGAVCHCRFTLAISYLACITDIFGCLLRNPVHYFGGWPCQDGDTMDPGRPTTCCPHRCDGIDAGIVSGVYNSGRTAFQRSDFPAQRTNASGHPTAMPWTQALQNLNLGYPKLTELQIMSAVTAVFSTVMQSGINLFVTLFIGFYMAISPDTYLQGFTHLIPKSKRERGCEILSALGHALRWWLVGRFASMAIVGVLTTIALQLINMPLALVLGVIAGLFTFVPYIGPIMSAVPAVLVALLESPVMALYVIVIYFVVQFIEGNFITPLLMERAVSLPPAVLLLAQFSMGIFYGLFGVLLATPLTIVLIIMIQMLYVQDVNRDRVKILGE